MNTILADDIYMAKGELTKILNNMNKEQLIELILEHYSARKDAKAFLDYYVNPDTDKLIDVCDKKLRKELARSKYGRSKARISVLKSIVKDLESYQPGYEVILDILYAIIYGLILVEYSYSISDSLAKGTIFMLERYLAIAESNYVLDKALDKMIKLLESDKIGHKYFRRQLMDSLNEYINTRSRI